MPPAARKTDLHLCTMIDPGPSPHVGGPITTPCSPDVKTNHLPQARGTDQAKCTGGAAPNFIVTGSGTVLVNNLPAARMTDKLMHQPPGLISAGSPNVLIGGPTVGVTLGNPGAGDAACKAAAATRASGNTQQSYQNCGVEASRQIINQAGGSRDEDSLLNESMRHGDADDERNRADSGGTSPSGRQRILARNGVPSSLQDSNMANITQAVAEGRGVITSHDVAILWGPGNSGGHAIVITGVEYGPDGKPATIITNDTGISTGNCSARYDPAVFRRSLRPGRPINVTNNPIW